MIRLFAATAVLLCAAEASAQDEIIGVRIREWYVTLDGKIEADSDTINSGPIDLDTTLGLDEREVAHEVQAYVNIPILGKIYAGAWWSSFEGDETLTQDVTFADRTFSASTQIHTELDLECYYLSYELTLPSIPLGIIDFEVGVLAGLRVIHVDGRMSASGQSVREEGTVGTPVLGVHVAVQFMDWLRADAEVMGLTFSTRGRTGRYFEAYGEIVAQPLPWLFAGVGYKLADLHVKDEKGDFDLESDLHLTGAYLTAGVRF